MGTWGVVFLGIIAFASAIQALFLVALLVFGRKLAQRVDALHSRIDRDITPALENFDRVSRAAAEIADIGALQARRVDLLLTDTIDKVEETTHLVQQFVVKPLKPVGGLLALLRGVQKGVEVYLQLGSRAPGVHAVPRRRGGHEDDEHLFI